MLPPRLLDAAGIDRVEPELVDEAQGPSLALLAGSPATGSAMRAGVPLWRALLEQTHEVDVVERLDHRPPEPLADPHTLELSRWISGMLPSRLG